MRVNFLRRISQLLILSLFILGNLGIFGFISGNLSSSVVLGRLSLSDPFAILQLFFAGFSLNFAAISGAFLIFIFYAFISPRAFCGWVCPVNLVSDFAYFMRVKFGFSRDKKWLNLPKNSRYFILGFSLILSFILGIPAFENISHIGFLQRGIIFLSSSAFSVALVIFAFDCFVFERGICSHLCPVGAFYAITSKFSLIRVKHDSKNCTKCMKCKVVCPEVQVLNFIGKRDGFVASECVSCGKCVEICSDEALEFSILRRK